MKTNYIDILRGLYQFEYQEANPNYAPFENVDSLVPDGFLEFDFSEEVIVPVFYREAICEKLINCARIDNCSPLVEMPVFIKDKCITGKGVKSILSQVFLHNYKTGMVKFKIGENDYIGGKGIILNSDLTPVMICALTGFYNKTIIGDIHYKKKVIYVDNHVLSFNNNLYTHIIKYFIPFLIVYPRMESPAMPYEVIIRSLSSYTKRILKPSLTKDLNDTLSGVIADNVSNIIMNL